MYVYRSAEVLRHRLHFHHQTDRAGRQNRLHRYQTLRQVADGMPRAQAYKFAAQSVLGSAKMVLETGKHPGELKDQVCSPGGTTIEAVRVLEEKGFRSSVIEAMKACVRKARGI